MHATGIKKFEKGADVERNSTRFRCMQLPSNESMPEWKMDGTIVTIADLPLNLFVSTLRDRIIAATGSSLPAGKLILSYNGKMLTNRNTIANYNLEEDDLLVLSVLDQKKK